MLSHKLKTALVLAAIVTQLMLVAIAMDNQSNLILQSEQCDMFLSHLSKTDPTFTFPYNFARQTIVPREHAWVTNFIQSIHNPTECKVEPILVAGLENVCKISSYGLRELNRSIADYVKICGTDEYWMAKVMEMRNSHEELLRGEVILPFEFLGECRARHENNPNIVGYFDLEDLLPMARNFERIYGRQNLVNGAFDECVKFSEKYESFMKIFFTALLLISPNKNLDSLVNRLPLLVKDEVLRFKICYYIDKNLRNFEAAIQRALAHPTYHSGTNAGSSIGSNSGSSIDSNSVISSSSSRRRSRSRSSFGSG